MSFKRRGSFTITKKKKIIKNVGEHYLRDDISCGSGLCEECSHMNEPPLETKESVTYILPDHNVIINQADWLSNTKVKNVILCSSALSYIREKHEMLFHRIREIAQDSTKHFFVFSNEFHRSTYIEKSPLETSEEREERACRKVCSWYKQHLKGAANILMITNDKEQKRKALEVGIDAKTVHEYVKESSDFELIDSLSGNDKGDDEEIPIGSTAIFEKYLTEDQVKERIRAKTLYSGSVKQNPDNYFEATVTCDGLDKDIYIFGTQARNRALPGDRVAVELLPESEWQSPSRLFIDIDLPENFEVGVDSEINELENENKPKNERLPTGKVVAIMKRNGFRKYCGSIVLDNASVDENTQVIFEAIDLRLPKVLIPTKQPQSLVDKRIVISIDSWPRYSKYPFGHFVRILGNTGDVEVESEALLIQHGISYEPFSAAVRACLPPADWHITEDDLLRRRDLRHLRIFSIDPPGCTDIDDALHVRELPNGNFELGVHIADVSHFIKESTAIDREARKRGCSVYLVEKRIDMIPAELSTNLCSLKSNVDRLAFSVVWELTPDAQIVNTEFFKSIIKSIHSFTYAQAQARIDNPSDVDPVTTDLRNLLKLARILRQRRLEKGALSLSSPQVKFKSEEENKDPIDVELYQMRETNSLIEEYMLLANVAVAEQIVKFFPSFALLRRHPPPIMKQFSALVDLVKQMGIELNIESSKSLAESLDKAQKKGDPYFNELLRILSTRCMTQAIYFSSGGKAQSEFYHYGLAIPIYTHFTSPIRRFADVIVHRLLAACIGAAELPTTLTYNNIQRTCDNINRRHRMADIAGRDSTRLHMLRFFKGKVVKEEARVTGVRANGFSVLVPRYGIEGKVYLTSCTSDTSKMWSYNPKKRLIVSPDNKYTIQVFETVTVQIQLDESRANAPRIIFTCINPPLSPATLIDSNKSDSTSTTDSSKSNQKKRKRDDEEQNSNKVSKIK